MDNWQQWRQQVDLDDYDRRWREMEAAGGNPHGEADLVAGYAPASVLDAGCGTGRIAIELGRRGIEVVGVDLDVEMLARARAKAPELTWVHGDLATLDLGRTFDVVVLAGNVIPFVDPAARAGAVAACARHVAPQGRLIAGFSLRPGWPSLADYDRWCSVAGLELEDRAAGWGRELFRATADYAVSIHRHRTNRSALDTSQRAEG